MPARFAAEHSPHEWAKDYEGAMRRLRDYITKAEDGTFRISIEDGKEIGVDPALFADLKRSLEHTNRMIKRGEIKSSEVAF